MVETLYPIFPYRKVNKNARCFIYGGGSVGKILMRQIEKSEFCQFIGFVDRNAEKHEKSVSDYIYIYPEKLCEYQYDYIIIGVLDNRGIKEKLQSLNVPTEKIVLLDDSDYCSENEFKGLFEKVHSCNNFLPSYLKIKNIDLHQSLSDFLKEYDVRELCTQRIISMKQPFEDILVANFRYQKDVFWLIDEKHYFKGIIRIKNIDLSKYEKGKLMEDIITDFEEDKGVSLEDSLESVIETILPMRTDGISVLDNDGKLIQVIDKASFYAAVSDLRELEEEPLIINRRIRDYSRVFPELGRYAYNQYSQYGEDGIIEEIFKRIGFQSKYAVEFGAWDGIFLSNIKNLIDKYEFKALYIEGDEKKAAAGMANYTSLSDRVHFMAGFVQHRKNRLLNDFLDEDNAPVNIDLLSIDVDGYDYHIWKSLTQYRPRCIVIEYNPTIPNHIIVVPPLRENASVGASAAALVELGMRKGYSLAAVTEANLIFVVNEEFDKLNITANELELLRPKEFQIENDWFMTYDCMIFNAGDMKHYRWQKGEAFSSDKFAVIS